MIRTVHIRKAGSKVRRGNQFYKPNWDDNAPQRETLCGAPAALDMSWAETRWEKNLAYVTCSECALIRRSKLA